MALVVKSWNHDAVDERTVFVHLQDEITGERMTVEVIFQPGLKAPWVLKVRHLFMARLTRRYG